MSDIIELFEEEIAAAVEVKDRSALRRLLTKAADYLVGRKDHEAAWGEVKTEVSETRREMAQGFGRMDDRFTEVDKQFASEDKQFTSVDQQFTSVRSEIQLIAELMEQGFARMDERFAAVDKRFEDMQHQMDKRFEETQHQMDRRFNMLVALSTTFFVVLATMMTLLRLFG